MPLRCRVCSRPDAGRINALLGERRSARSIALEFGLSEDTVQRHAARHLGRAAPIGAVPATPPTTVGSPPSADPLDELVEALRDKALAGDPAIVHQYRLALQAQSDARHAAPPTRALEAEPEWHVLRTRLLEVLEPFPEARAAVRDALR